MESEAYAHALLCDLLAVSVIPGSDRESPAAIADGIRLWLMLQKETQHWDTEPAYIDAITSILDGSQAVLNTRVLALSGTYRAPFKDIKAAGTSRRPATASNWSGSSIKRGPTWSLSPATRWPWVTR